VQRCFIAGPFPHSCHERLNSLATLQFAFSILAKSSLDTVPCGRDARVGETAGCDCAVSHMPTAADPLLSILWRRGARTNRMSIRTTHKLLTGSWIADVEAVETAIGRWADRGVTNDCRVVLFEIARDEHLHVNVIHKYRTRTVGEWAGPASLQGRFVHNRIFGHAKPTEIIGHIKEIVFASRT